MRGSRRTRTPGIPGIAGRPPATDVRASAYRRSAGCSSARSLPRALPAPGRSTTPPGASRLSTSSRSCRRSSTRPPAVTAPPRMPLHASVPAGLPEGLRLTSSAPSASHKQRSANCPANAPDTFPVPNHSCLTRLPMSSMTRALTGRARGRKGALTARCVCADARLKGWRLRAAWRCRPGQVGIRGASRARPARSSKCCSDARRSASSASAGLASRTEHRAS